MNKRMSLIIAAVLVLAIGGIAIASGSAFDSAERQIKLAYKLLDEGEYQEAILAFQKVIEIEPRSTKAYVGLGLAYAHRGDYDKAYATVNDVLGKGLDSPELLHEAMVKIYLLQGDERGAKVYMKAITDPQILKYLKERFPELFTSQIGENGIASNRINTVPGIDGVLEELWERPQVNKTLSYTNSIGSVQYPMKAYFMHDDGFLYIAVVIEGHSFSGAGKSERTPRLDNLYVSFDNNNNGNIEVGETILHFNGLDFELNKYNGNNHYSIDSNTQIGLTGVAAHSNKDGSGNYTYECKIPMEIFGGTTTGIKLWFDEKIMTYDGTYTYGKGDGVDAWPTLDSMFDGETYAKLYFID